MHRFDIASGKSELIRLWYRFKSNRPELGEVLNTNKYDLNSRFNLILNSDPSVCDIAPGSLDFIVANPPYIPSKEVNGLMSGC